jgi:hypothetical protein
MTLLLSGTNGLSDVDGTAATPAIRGTDANTGIFFPAADTIAFSEGGAEAMRIDSSGNVGIGTSSPTAKLDVYSASPEIARIQGGSAGAGYLRFADTTNANIAYVGRNNTSDLYIWQQAAGGSIRFGAVNSQVAQFDSSGNLLVGTTSVLKANRRLQVLGGGTIPAIFKTESAGTECLNLWNSATSGNNFFAEFQTETVDVARGTISYNRAAGLVSYNTTSDYRAKDITGLLTDSGAVIDSVPVYMGKMKGATQERPMFIAHEVPAYAHTGEKDAVDADGKPVYQQMDASALVPVMWAEIQSLRARVAQLEAT